MWSEQQNPFSLWPQRRPFVWLVPAFGVCYWRDSRGRCPRLARLGSRKKPKIFMLVIPCLVAGVWVIFDSCPLVRTCAFSSRRRERPWEVCVTASKKAAGNRPRPLGLDRGNITDNCSIVGMTASGATNVP
eukprot:GHVT01098371.1.p2 GENE.GHVT01098371.1~~GHVT01098371.1.p2  ORF type:complete len:131 (+),score=9.91 GHVT01098371.1:266-658(+)